MRSVPPPRRGPAAGWLALMVALCLLAACAAGAHDLFVHLGWVPQRPWLPGAISTGDGLSVQWWTAPASAALVVLGLVILAIAVKPRRRTHLAAPGDDIDLWIAPRALSTLASDTAARMDGANAAVARTRLRRRRIDLVVATTTDDAESLSARVTEAVTERIAPLSDATVRVRREAPQT